MPIWKRESLVGEVRAALDGKALHEPFRRIVHPQVGWRRIQQLFRQELRISPRQYFERRRFTHALFRLAHPDAEVKEVASELGFRSLSHFSVWFKRHTGRCPRVFQGRL